MIAIQIEPSVGRCDSCHKFRNNMEWEVDEKVVCLDCYKTFKNQRLIDEVIAKAVVKEKKIRKPRVYKPRGILEPKYPNYARKKPGELRNVEIIKANLITFIKESPRPVSVAEILAQKIACKTTVRKYLQGLLLTGEVHLLSLNKGYYIDPERYQEFKDYRPLKGKYAAKKPLLTDKILEIIKASSSPLTPLEINHNQPWHSKSVYPALAKLVEWGKVVCAPTSETSYLYIDIERIHLLEDDINYFEKNLLGKKTRTALELILSKKELTYNKDIAIELGVDKSTVVRIIQSLKDKNLIVASNFGGSKKRATVIAPIGNKELCKQVEEIENNSTDKLLRKLIENASGKPYTVSDCCVLIGCHRGSDGSRKFIKKLLIEWGCKTVKKSNGIGYYLEKVEG